MALRTHLVVLGWILAVLVLAPPACGAAGSATPIPQAVRRAKVACVQGSIVVDGNLDEPDWGSAATIGEILQREPQPGQQASERTEVKLLLDEQNLYIGVICHDSEPGRVIGTQMARDADLSADNLFYSITPSLRLTATYNTDFAETEVDEQQTNLTRFPLFFPEKRGFFLENAGVFEFGSSLTGNTEIVPFYSRRIGLLEGRQVPVQGGAKITGNAQSWNIGALWVRTDDSLGAGSNDFAVARLRRNLLKQSSVGAIVTDGSPDGRTARTYGGDLDMATSNFLGRGRNFGVQAFALRSQNAWAHGPDAAFGASLRYPNDLWDVRLAWRQIEADFDPAIGFVERTGVRRIDVAAEYDPRPSRFLNVRQMFHEFRYRRITRLDAGRVEGWRFFVAPVNWTLESGDRFEINYIPYFERVFPGETEEVGPGVVVGTGDYRFTRGRVEFGTAQKRPWVVEGTWWFGEFWTGHADQIEAAAECKLAPHFRARMSLDEAFASLPEGHFIERVLGLHADWSASPFLGIFNFAQYDNESRTLGLQSRVRWILRPGNDVFLVVSNGLIQDPTGGLRFHSAETHATLKTQYTFRF